MEKEETGEKIMTLFDMDKPRYKARNRQFKVFEIETR